MRELTAELITSSWVPREVRLSPDGTRVAWTAEPRGREGEHAESGIWMAATDGSTPAKRWTQGGADRHPRWSPDGARLAFLSDRRDRGTAGLYVMEAAGGEASPLVVRKRSVETFAWSPDGARIAFVAPDEPTDEDERREKERDDADVRGERWRYGRLHVVDVATGDVSDLPVGDVHVFEVTWSPDGRELAFLSRRTPELDSRPVAIQVVAADGGAPRQVAEANAGGLKWTAGGRLVFAAPHGLTELSAATVWSLDPAGGTPVVIGPGPDEERCGLDVYVVPGEARMAVRIAEGLDTRFAWVDPSGGGAPEPLYETGTGVEPADVVVGPGGPVLALGHTSTAPLEVWAGPPDRLRQLRDHGAGLADVRFGVVEEFRWTAPDGLPMDGVLVRPPDAGPGPLPTVVLAHGGPYSRSTRGIVLGGLSWSQWLATAGFAVILPNYRGGAGRGRAFADAAWGDMGGAEFGDVMSAVDTAVERGIADPDRLGIGGWSQGGFLTAWAVTQTNRFRAAVMGAGISDWGMMALTSDVPRFEAQLTGSRPWDGPQLLAADVRSPIRYARRVTTPVLILHGERDERVPLSQAIGFERALRDIGATAQLVVYPREGHPIVERRHQQDVLRRVREWFARWLLQSDGAQDRPQLQPD
jgi:dipeptidyl aminopeptidase/acylaminoacyl peptidase